MCHRLGQVFSAVPRFAPARIGLDRLAFEIKQLPEPDEAANAE
jgi:hypothetical protein